MADLTFANLRRANLARDAEKWGAMGAWSPELWLTRMMTEVGELAEEISRSAEADLAEIPFALGGPAGEDGFKARVANELADVAMFLDLLAASLGVELGAAIVAKFNSKSAEWGVGVRLDP